MSNRPLAIVVAVLLVISLTISTASPIRGPQLPVSASSIPLPSSAYVTMYQIQNNSSDASPWILYPASNKTVLVVTIKLGHVIQSQIVNFTMGVPPKPIATLNNTIPTDIVYDHFAKTTQSGSGSLRTIPWLITIRRRENSKLRCHFPGEPPSISLSIRQTTFGSPSSKRHRS